MKKTMQLLGISVITLVTCFIVGGAICNLFLNKMNYIQERFRTDEFKVPFPYVMFKGLPHVRDHNEGGYRGKYPSKNKPKNEYRVILLGGSSVYLGDPTVTELLEENFQKNGYINVRVYNFGVISNSSSQELMTIVKEVSELQPDLIIQYNGANDLYHPLYYDPRPGYPYDFLVYEASPLLYPKKLSAIKFFFYKNSLVRFIGERLFPTYYMNQLLPLNTLRREAGYGTDTWKEQIADIYVSNIVKAQKISMAFGGEYIAIFQPTVYEKKHITDEEAPIFVPSETTYFREIKKKIFQRVTLPTYQDVHFVDLSLYFDSVESTMFSDVMHVYQDSQPFIAEAIYNSIMNRIFISR